MIIVRFKMRKVFQSTLPREERHPTPHSLTGMYYFNPRSHERSDHFAKHHVRIVNISIHAPTRGATMHQCRHSLQPSNFNPRSHERSDKKADISTVRDNIFQSTLPREERLLGVTFTLRSTYFNPRSHERSDDCDRYAQLTFNGISIHAPTRGATTSVSDKLIMTQFQSTLPREERPGEAVNFVTSSTFQSTLPREERLH